MNWFKRILSVIFTVLLLLGFALPLNPVGNWYQQFLPSIGNRQINDIIFLDSLNGFAVASRNDNPDTASILKTTNGGDTWQIVFTQGSRRFSKVKFINNDTGLVCGGTGAGTPYIYKTTNAGISWTVISSSGCAFWNDMHVLSNDTIWVVDSDGLWIKPLHRNTLAELQKMKQEGKIRAIGACNCNLNQLRAYGKIYADQEKFGLLDRNLATGGVLDYCRENGISVLAYSPLANGLLTVKVGIPAVITTISDPAVSL